MLRRLVGDRDARERTELTGPHAGAVDDDIRPDVAERRVHAGHVPAVVQNAGRWHALEDLHAPRARALGESHRDVHRIHAAVLLHIEAGLEIIHLRERKQLLHLARGELVYVHSTIAIERRDTPIFLEPVLVGCDFDEADWRESRGLAGFRLEATVKGARVLAHLGRGFGSRPESHHQTRGVPGRPGGEPVTFQQDDVLPAHHSEVVCHGGADDSAPDDDDAGVGGNAGGARIGGGHWHHRTDGGAGLQSVPAGIRCGPAWAQAWAYFQAEPLRHKTVLCRASHIRA